MQTELAAVNSLLVAIGESPQNTLEIDNVDITIAREVINTASINFQSEGWWFNTEIWEMGLTTENKQPLPINTLYVNTHNPYWVKRGNYLYDSENHTYIFDPEDVSDKSMTILTLLPLDELPGIVYNYIVNLGKVQMLSELEAEFNKIQIVNSILSYQRVSIQRMQLRFTSSSALTSPMATKLLQNIRLP